MKKKRAVILSLLTVVVIAATVALVLILKKTDIADCTVTMSDSHVYTGETIEPAVTVRHKDKTLVQKEDFTVQYEDNVNAGKAAVILTGTGRHYKGSKKMSFTIEPAPLSPQYTLHVIDSEPYTGEAISPNVAVKAGDKKLLENVEYNVSYENNTHAGIATVTVTGTGNYTGTLSQNFKITPPETTMADASETDSDITVKWNAQTEETAGYELEYATSVKFDTDNKTITINDNQTTSAKITKDKKDTAYYIRIRTYTGEGEDICCSPWSEPIEADGFTPLKSALTAAVKVHGAVLYKRDDGEAPHVADLPFSSKVSATKAKGGWFYVTFKSGDTTYEGYLPKSNVVTYDPGKKHIALTFDDGPKASTTPVVLEALKKHKCRATFFIVGKNVTGETTGIVKAEKDLGCELGNHSFAHPKLTSLEEEAAMEQLTKTDDAIKAVTGSAPSLCRAPYGSVNDDVLTWMNRPHIMWSVDTLDWKYRDTEKLIETVKETRADGEIILMHDIHESTVNAIDQICEDLVAEGYETVTVTELAAINGKPLDAKTTYHHFRK